MDLAANAVADLDLEIETLKQQLFAREAKRPHFALRVQRLAAQLARLEEDLDQAREAEAESESPGPHG